MTAEDRAAFARLGVVVPDGERASGPAARPAAPQRRAMAELVLARHLMGAFRLCEALSTQLRAVASGAGTLLLGFDYGPRLDLCTTLGLPRRGQAGERLLRHLRVMEDEFVAARNRGAAGARPSAESAAPMALVSD